MEVGFNLEGTSSCHVISRRGFIEIIIESRELETFWSLSLSIVRAILSRQLAYWEFSNFVFKRIDTGPYGVGCVTRNVREQSHDAHSLERRRLRGWGVHFSCLVSPRDSLMAALRALASVKASKESLAENL